MPSGKKRKRHKVATTLKKRKMSKKDRIALVISFFYTLLSFSLTINSRYSDWYITLIILLVPVMIYWSYRFIKNNISFLNKEEKN